jgi:putative peptidoglycan lipid II flippase
LLSRLLGLARDILLFASLGGGMASSAFILAFTLPNLFRRLLGEGALATASVPVLAECLEREGRDSTHNIFNGILSRLSIILGALTLLVWLALECVRLVPALAPRWYLAADLSRWLFPYVILVCLSAMYGSMLQIYRRFDLPALSQVWLNLAMIAALAAGLLLPWAADPIWRVRLLTGGVLAGGLLQWWIPRHALRGNGWQPRWDFRPHPRNRQILALLLPGLLGAAIFQINIFISRLLAFSLDDTAAAYLYLANRMIEFPLGVFAIAVSTVLFPELARLAAQRDDSGYTSAYRQGLQMIALITIPAAVGLALLAQPILVCLFEWGMFAADDVRAAVPVLQCGAAGLPFFAWSTILSRGYHARQDMRTPLRLACWNLLLNLLLSVLLMRRFGAAGLAAANAIAAACHCLLLQWRLRTRHLPGLTISGAGLGRIGLATAVMAIAVWLGWQALAGWLGAGAKSASMLAAGPLTITGAAVYFAMLHALGWRPRQLLDKTL